MPGSSELSDALNPFYSSQDASSSYDYRHATSQYNNLNHQNEVPQPSISDAVDVQYYSPEHSSQSLPDSIQSLKGLIQTLVKSIKGYKSIVENEKERRLAWEQDKEEGYKARISELETQIKTMQKEISTLKGKINRVQKQDPAGKAKYSQEFIVDFDDTAPETAEPASSTQPEFIQGSSEATSTLRKRHRSGSPPHTDGGEPSKVRAYRDGRFQTIHAAMRNHILKCMKLDTDKELPPSHEEGRILTRTDPVRFVWEQTTKKSANNTKMKSRIIDDLIMNKAQYPLVPDGEFLKAKLDNVFEQAFTTLRQKYTAQNNSRPAPPQNRGDVKAARARRLGRKKVKLANRISTRKNLPDLGLPGFNAAFQLDCMSSEESEIESDGAIDDEGQVTSYSFLRIRVLSWRSSRLNRLYAQIDAREEQDRSTKPRRGIGRKDRRPGRPKDGSIMPPIGVAKWMVSKKWMKETNVVNARLTKVLEEGMKENDADDTFVRALNTLGEESDDNGDDTAVQYQQQQEESMQLPQSQTQYHNPPILNGLLSQMTGEAYYTQQEQQAYIYTAPAEWTNEYGDIVSYPSVLHMPNGTYQQ